MLLTHCKSARLSVKVRLVTKSFSSSNTILHDICIVFNKIVLLQCRLTLGMVSGQFVNKPRQVMLLAIMCCLCIAYLVSVVMVMAVLTFTG